MISFVTFYLKARGLFHSIPQIKWIKFDAPFHGTNCVFKVTSLAMLFES